MILEHTTDKSPAIVFDYLTDMQKFVSIHPVIFKMDRLNGNEYLVHETLKIGPVRISFRYPAIVNGSVDQRSVTMRATVMKITSVKMTFSLREIPTGTQVEEEIIFSSILPIGFILQRIFRVQHTKLFENLRNAK